MDSEKIVALGEFINKSLFDGSAKTNPAFDEGVILFTQQVLALLKEHDSVKPRVSSVEQRCGNCNKIIEMDGWKACPWCGKPINWESWWSEHEAYRR